MLEKRQPTYDNQIKITVAFVKIQYILLSTNILYSLPVERSVTVLYISSEWTAGGERPASLLPLITFIISIQQELTDLLSHLRPPLPPLSLRQDVFWETVY